MKFEWRLAERVETHDKVYIGQEVAGGVHVQVLLQPPLGAGIVELPSTGQYEQEIVVGM